MTRASLLCSFALLSVLTIATHAQVRATLTVVPSTRYQTFRGWEVAILPTVLDYYGDRPALDAAFRLAATDLGITRIKVGMFAGTEGPKGRSDSYLAQTMPERQFIREHGYNVINDNKDPKVADPDGFDFGILDWQMTNMVLPFSAHLTAAGEKPVFILGYGDYGASPFGHHDKPAEYAELMSATFAHLAATHGRVPDQLDIINEPDLTKGRWVGREIGKILLATALRLKDEGYTPGFIGPSTMDRGHALPYLAEMLETKRVDQFLTQISYHCYADTGKNTLSQIGQVVSKTHLESAQDECWGEGNNAVSLMADLKLAHVSAWQQATLNGPNGYYLLNPADGTATLRPKTRLLRQFYRYIRPGAVRVEVGTSDPAMDPVAFIAPDGHFVVVVVAKGAGGADVAGLPDGTYDVSYSTGGAFDVHTSATVTNGEPLGVSIPDGGVLTISGPSAATIQ